MHHDRDVIRPSALGDSRRLLEAVARSTLQPAPRRDGVKVDGLDAWR